ncbi:hypothetical protein QE405_000143 [Nocardioides zeae]|uniref:Uncharacterized protein n=1 Tax=Nocardioides zeae TaxID=1457234 RepID=A0AAJ1X083_9ACTN|nr:hypothetical protein [Nocardioides zeae]
MPVLATSLDRSVPKLTEMIVPGSNRASIAVAERVDLRHERRDPFWDQPVESYSLSQRGV